MRPDALAVRALLGSVARRAGVRAVALGGAAGFAAASLPLLFGWPRATWPAAGVAAATLLISLLILFLLTSADIRRPAALVERRDPRSRNLIATAAELVHAPRDGYAHAMVLGRAAELARRLDPATLLPLRAAAFAFAAAFATWLLLVTRAGEPVLPRAIRAATGASRPELDRIDVIVEPPAYTGRAASTLRNPSRVEALAGSRIRVAVRANASAGVAIETLASHDTVAVRDGAAVVTLNADADGFIALQPFSATAQGARQLIGITVLPDAPPQVRISRPGRDTVLADGHASLAIAIESSDDIGLASLRLRYTKVSGSGERFSFADGEVPITVTRESATRWTARVRWPLDSLELGAGDMVVYRAVTSDRRPNATASESDAYIAEVASPGGQAAPGFAVDPEQDKYAVSQQMVILKTERLLARRASMAPDDYATAAQEIAAEQRKVRAEFVFMLGGELADAPDVAASMTELNEETEAEGEQDLLAGRNANAGHVALLRAIRAMSRAATSLTNGEVQPALPHERSALASIESAFSRARIILRALTTRERLDPARRLTGSLADAAGESRARAEGTLPARVVALRRALADVSSIAGGERRGDEAASALALLAERVLRTDATSPGLQQVASDLSTAAKAMRDHRADAARAALDRAATGIASELRGELPLEPSITPSIGDAMLRGALIDAARRKVP